MVWACSLNEQIQVPDVILVAACSTYLKTICLLGNSYNLLKRDLAHEVFSRDLQALNEVLAKREPSPAYLKPASEPPPANLRHAGKPDEGFTTRPMYTVVRTRNWRGGLGSVPPRR